MIITLQTLIFFRESLLNVLDRLLRPYYNKLSLAFGRNGEASDDEESDEQVFAEYDEEKGVVFYPPMYLQRYAAVSDCLMDEQWCGKLEKVVDLGYHDMSFINYLKEVQGVKCILGVDLESIPLRCSIDLIGCEDYVPKRENSLEVTLFKGNAADPDYRLIGCDAVIAIEMIEHMLPHDLDRLIHTVFGFIKPWIAIFTTPNGDFNVLFKAMEKNGLRRLDHFFEWSREQFHDWCSNIVVRYPQYTVSRKGVGPGPSGTTHLGCCSQMALFVSKEYNKQQDLNLNSLALVSDTPSPHSITNLISSWETPDIPNESNMIEPPKDTESYSTLQSSNQSSITLVLTSPSSSLESIPYQDKTSQCNLDTETERGYLMFDYEQMCFDVLQPQRNVNNHRVYHIEDVNNRLNCTTLEVKKFSKTTLNLMAKNKVNNLVHTRQVVDEIRHLTKMLNFNKELHNQITENGTHTWCNINWGENAPYWNQYYRIVKAYNYPFEVKSDECRILDLISDEINRLIDTHFDEDFSFEVHKLEIPLELLMRVVEHITDDVERVKELLEWNGYEVLGNFVIHSRMVVDYSSAGTQEDDSPETSDVYSDWDSTSFSDGSTTVPDYNARCLRRALDQKVRKLRSMLTADEDIATELDQVVCRLMKLALRTSKGRTTPPPTRWMQCKLLDLLTLTEKTIERRKKHFIESYPLKAINYEEKSQEMIALEKIKEDNTALLIVDKYKHLVNQTDDMDAQYRYLDFDLEDDLSATSTEFVKDYEFIDEHPINLNLIPEAIVPSTEIFQTEDVAPQGESKLQRTQAWVEEDIEVVPYPIHDGNFDNSSVDTDHNAAKFTRYYKKRLRGKQSIELNCVIRKKSHSKAYKQHRIDDKSKNNSNTKLVKKMSRKKSCHKSSGVQTTHSKFVSVDYRSSKSKSRRKQDKNRYPTTAKPIPVSLIELCHPEMIIGHDIGPFNSMKGSMTKISQDKTSYDMEAEIAATKESKLIELITEDAKETIALQRTIGTDADADSMIFEDETLIRSVSNTLVNEDYIFEKHNIVTENDHSKTIFLYDINEPTTSKGIRHSGMDVQCGPDANAPVYSMLSATTSLTRVPTLFKERIKIEEFATETKIISTDFGTCTYDADNSYRIITPRNRSIGIKIKDSDSNIIVNRMELTTMSTFSALSSIASLTRMPKTSEIEVGNSIIDNRIKNTDVGACTNTLESDFSMERTVGIKINNSLSIIPNRLKSSTNTNAPFDYKTDIAKVTTIFKSSPLNSVQHKGSDKSVSVNIECLTNTQELYDKLIVSSQQLFKNESEILKELRVELEFKDFSSNFPNRIEYPGKTQESCDESNSLSNNKIKKQKSTKGMQKKTVDFQLHDPVSHIPKRVNHPTACRPKSCHEPVVSLQKTTTKVISMKKSKRSDAVCDSYPKRITELHCLTDTDNLITLSPMPPSFCKETRLMISKLEPTSIGTEIGNHNSNSPEKVDCLAETLGNGKSNVSRSFVKETTTVKSQREQKNDDTTSDIYASVNGACNTLTCVTLDNSDLAANKIHNNSEKPGVKYVKRKLCTGGVQVQSYRDKQALSEDVMYQGQWQQNKPNVLARKKCGIPVVLKRKDLILKKKTNSKELLKFNRSKSMEKKYYNIKVNNDLKKELKQTLISYNKVKTNLKQESDIKENKHDQKPNTMCAGTIAKPFRNILKVPSKFPVSALPSKTTKSFVVNKNPTALPVTKDEKKQKERITKNYIPLYLRQCGIGSTNKFGKADLNLSLDSATSKLKKTNENNPKPLVRSKTEEIKCNLLKFRTKPLQSEYVVFRNEIEKKKSDGQQIKNTETVRKKDVYRQRSSSPTSANSSTCSSPCSIATIRPVAARTRNVTNHRHSTSSYMNNTATSGSENSTPERNKQFTRRCKSARVTVENKENIPQTSKHLNVNKKESLKLNKGIFIGQKKNVYISQVKDSLQSTANTLSKHKIQKSNVNIPSTKSFTDKKSSSRQTPSVSNKESVMIDASLSTSHSNKISECAQTSNMVLIIEPQVRQLHVPTDITIVDDTNVNHSFVTKNVDEIGEEAVDSHSNQNISTMRELLEDTLDFIHYPLDDECNIDSETVIFNNENVAPHIDAPASPTSFKTAITSDDNNEVLPSDIEYALNHSFDTNTGNDSIVSLNDTHFKVTDFDVLSFKSMTSGSKLSGYLSADTEFSSSIKLPKCTIPAPFSTSVRDIFERKEQPLLPAENQNTSSALANQVFSGFTINEDSIAGDKPDLVNLIDSETGSLLAVAIPRQAIMNRRDLMVQVLSLSHDVPIQTSEELLISGRSSESFESCVLDDDTVVPNWLFQLISHQAASLDELEPPAELLAPLPVVEPLFDDNANVVEAPGAGAGAGDGRGIHSDHSQDSSGRGTSVSSSETSSGAQSEAILIDPAAFAAQFELLRDAVEGSVVMAINNPEASDNVTDSRLGVQESEPQSFSGGESRRTPRPTAASASDADADADISSLDTDEVPDSSDN